MSYNSIGTYLNVITDSYVAKNDSSSAYHDIVTN